MIVRLLPTQVSGLWSLVKTGIVTFGAKHFPGNWELSNNIFQRCLAGLVQVWLCSEEVEGKDPEFKGFFLTSVELDNVDGARTLAIMTVYTYKQPSPALLAEGRQVIEAFAKENKCKQITLSAPAGHREKLVDALWPKGKKHTLFVIPVEV